MKHTCSWCGTPATHSIQCGHETQYACRDLQCLDAIRDTVASRGRKTLKGKRLPVIETKLR